MIELEYVVSEKLNPGPFTIPRWMIKSARIHYSYLMLS
jgi:hypothetical protein